jgi:ABC-type branched-subunit amino acid transport system ATPase component
VGEGEVVCLVGRNGAGKTTTLRTIMGYLRPRAGRIAFRGRDIQGRRTAEVARRGLGFAPEDSGIFADLGPAVLMAESNIHHVPEFATRLYVIERREIIFAGRPEDVHADRTAMRVIGGAT